MHDSAQRLIEQRAEAESSLAPCSCGGKLGVRYEPGLTKLTCHKCKVIASLPDWQPQEIAKRYNEKTT